MHILNIFNAMPNIIYLFKFIINLTNTSIVLDFYSRKYLQLFLSIYYFQWYSLLISETSLNLFGIQVVSKNNCIRKNVS